MKFLSILVKPASGLCNISCDYCFYRELSDGLCSEKHMRPEVAEQLIEKALAAGAEEVLFAFQGGEPLLAGHAFYEHFAAAVEARRGRTKVSYSVQTNGTLLDDEYIRLFKKYGFLAGVSLDGPKYIHDVHRLTPDGRGTFQPALENAKRLQAAGVQVNILSVVTGDAAARAEKLYRFFKKNGFRFLQFLPCMDPVHAEQGGGEASLTNGAYYKFLSELFELWYRDLCAGEYISIRHFDNWVRLLQHRPVDTCSLSGRCGSYFVVEANGDVYPCDFYVGEEFLLGNICTDTFSMLLQRLEQSGFLTEAAARRSGQCGRCGNEDLCHGGCKRDWVMGEQGGRTRYCAALDRFFTENRGRMLQVAEALA